MSIQYTSATYVSVTQFKITGDYTAIFLANKRRVICNCGVDGLIIGDVTESSYSGGETTVTIGNATGNLTNNLNGVAVGDLHSDENSALPPHTHTGKGAGNLITEASISDLDKYTQIEVDSLLTTLSGYLNDYFLKKDGTTALTGDWDIGDGRKIEADQIAARNGAGLKLTDDGGNGMFVCEGGNIGINTITPNYKLDINGDAHVTSNFRIDGGATIYGNLTVSGTTFTTQHETVEITDNLLLINNGEVGAGVTASGSIAGIEVDRGSETNYRFVFDENSDNFRVGEIGDLQAVATREDSPINKGIPFWNSTESKFDTDTDFVFNAGKVGIGSTVPNCTLDVRQANATMNYQADGTYTASFGNASGKRVSIGYDETTQDIGVISSVQAGIAWKDLSINPNGGNVGIGTNAPATKLHIGSGTGIRITGTGTNHPILALFNNNTQVGVVSVALTDNAGFAGTSTNDFFIKNVQNKALRFGTNNLERVTILGDGNVGIGSTAPSAILHIKEGDDGLAVSPPANTALAIESDGSTQLQFLSPNSQYKSIYFNEGADADGAQFRYYFDTVAANSRYEFRGNASEWMRIQNGNVGIGTNAPSYRQHIKQTAGAAGPDLMLENTVGDSYPTVRFKNDAVEWRVYGCDGSQNDSYVWYQNGTKMVLTTGGDLGIGTDSPGRTLHVNSASADICALLESTDAGAYLSFKDNTTGGDSWTRIGTIGNELSIWTNNGERVRIDNNGNVGIGTNAPGKKLHVNSGAVETAACFESTDERAQIQLKDDTASCYVAGIDGKFRVYTNNGSTQAMDIDNNGNVGIGTDTPDGLLDLGANNILLMDEITAGQTGFIGFGAYYDGEKIRAQGGSYYGFAIDVDRPNQVLNFQAYAGSGSVANILTMNRTGNVGIGTNAPSYRQHIKQTAGAAGPDLMLENTVGDSYPTVRFKNDAVEWRLYGCDGSQNDSYVWYQNGTKMVLTTDGDLGIGTNAPETKLHIGSGTGIRISGTGTNHPKLDLFNNTTQVGVVSVALTDNAGFAGTSTNDFFIKNVQNKALRFGTNNLERVTILGDGNVGIGTNSPVHLFEVKETSNRPNYAAVFWNDQDHQDANGIKIQAGTDDTSGQTYHIAAFDGDGDIIGYIWNNNGTFELVDASDESIKCNIEEVSLDGLSVINSIPVKQFNYLKNPKGPKRTGFIAQDVLAVYPEAVAEDTTVSGVVTLGVVKTSLIPPMIEAIQTLSKRVEELEAQLA